jgi:hypothetical protein
VSWKVTVRHGPEVKRERVETLDQAVEEARGYLDAARREARLGTVSMLRDFTPDVRVQARVEISSPGLLRSREGGIDLMGDGSTIAYRGTVRKRRLDADSLDEALERLREALA